MKYTKNHWKGGNRLPVNSFTSANLENSFCILTGGNHMEHARLLLLSSGVDRPTSDRPVVAVSDASTSRPWDGRAVGEHRRQPVTFPGQRATANRLDVLHHLVAADVGHYAVSPVEGPFEHFRCRVRVHLAQDFRVLVPGYAVRQFLVLFAHRLVCNVYAFQTVRITLDLQQSVSPSVCPGK